MVNLSVFVIIALCLPVIALISFFKASVKGNIGEKRVAKRLAKLNPNHYTVLNDVMLKFHNGKTSQIDHIVFSQYGIFVIETKNMSGTIYVDKNRKYWTQLIGKQKHKLYSPIMQNDGHCRALTAATQLPSDVMHSVVVFAGNAKLKGGLLGLPSNVMRLNKLLRRIKREKTALLTPHQIELALHGLELHQVENNRSNHKQHLKNVRRKKRRWW